VASYLAGRGIILSPPLSLRWAPTLRRPEGTYAPAMVARVDSVDGELIGVHRTWLDRDAAGMWHRHDRASLGPIGGGAVRLGGLRPDTTLIVAEGIESGLSAAQLTGWPAWAALSAGGIERLVLPLGAQDVVIAVDHDRNGTGEAAARCLAARLVCEERRVRLLVPNQLGADVNDLLREARRAAA